MKQFLRPLASLIVALVVVLSSATAALAHGHTTVGDYEFVIGFIKEPAYAGEPNGLDLTVTNTKTGAKVNNLAESLKVEIIAGSNKRELPVRAQWGKDGGYTADVLPVASGDYTWHIWGTIEGTPVDVRMTSGEKTFGAVKSKESVAFPAAEATTAELQSQADAAAASAQQALYVAIAGVVFGLVGIGFGVLAWRTRCQATPAVGRSQRAA